MKREQEPTPKTTQHIRRENDENDARDKQQEGNAVCYINIYICVYGLYTAAE